MSCTVVAATHTAADTCLTDYCVDCEYCANCACNGNGAQFTVVEYANAAEQHEQQLSQLQIPLTCATGTCATLTATAAIAARESGGTSTPGPGPRVSRRRNHSDNNVYSFIPFLLLSGILLITLALLIGTSFLYLQCK